MHAQDPTGHEADTEHENRRTDDLPERQIDFKRHPASLINCLPEVQPDDVAASDPRAGVQPSPTSRAAGGRMITSGPFGVPDRVSRNAAGGRRLDDEPNEEHQMTDDRQPEPDHS